jgi:hypothetical protein
MRSAPFSRPPGAAATAAGALLAAPRAAFAPDPHTFVRHASGGELIRLVFHAPLARPPAEATVSASPDFFLRFGPAYTTLVTVVMGEESRQTVLSLEDPSEPFTFAAAGPL